MANQYFENFPTTQYKLANGKWITIKDFFRKSKIDQGALHKVIDYEYYELQDGERPDVVATKLYGNGDLHWTLLLVNEMESYFDWHKDTPTFEAYLKEKYPGQYLTFSNTSDMIDEDGKFLLGEEIKSNTGNTAHVIKVEPTYNRIGVDGRIDFIGGDTITGSEKTADWALYQAKSAARPPVATGARQGIQPSDDQRAVRYKVCATPVRHAASLLAGRHRITSRYPIARHRDF